VTRELAWVGAVALLFGLGSSYASGELGAFGAVNLGLAAAALAGALAGGARRLRGVGGPQARRVVALGVLRIGLAGLLAAGFERAAARAELRFDWTFERRFELSEATRKALHELTGPIEALLFHDPLDPRRRQTELLLESLAREGPVQVRTLALDAAEEEADRYEVAQSNSVVLVAGDRFETVERPSEGAIYEALYRLRERRSGTLLFLGGEGEGDLERRDALGYSGLAAALETEGYEIATAASAALAEVPAGVDAVVVIAPRRQLLPGAIDALRAWLEGGGRLVALLEPGVDSGLEALLAEYGLQSPDAVVVDPFSAVLEEEARGIAPLIHNYESHPATHGLDASRMTVFHGARAFALRKPRTLDGVQRTALSSPRAWLSPDLGLLRARGGAPEPDGSPQGYQTLAAAGRYPRDGGETRIAVFGDADFASNRWLRALYNLDLILNAVHWVAEREPEITLRPKVRTPLNFPVPLANTVHALYGVGLLVPELLLVVGGVVWLRRRSA
jgi:hypothetical protein